MIGGPASATYRLQLGSGFRLADALAAVPYLDSLGVGALYLSPITAATAGSTHGYDVCDPTAINPELGDEDDLRALSAALAARGMGLLIDIVPNHMAATTANRWWRNLLADGPDSPDAPVFDIDWRPTGATGRGQVLLPVLGAYYGEVLARGEIRLALEDDEPVVAYHDRRFPLAVHSWPAPLEAIAARADHGGGAWAGAIASLAGEIRAARAEPAGADAAGTDAPRFLDPRAAAGLRGRLAGILTAHPGAREAVAAALEAERDPDRLHALLEQQAYRLAYWRIANERINYRRFFDVADLVGVRVGDTEVFARVHELALRLVREGLVSGLRIDHIDGLWDPHAYLERLQVAARGDGVGQGERVWIVVEKILSGDEQLPGEWPVAGTTGYEFGRAVTSALLDPVGLAALDDLYHRFIGRPERFADLLHRQKLRVLDELFAGEIAQRSAELNRLAELDRSARDLSHRQLGEALAEVTAAFSAYRTYARDLVQRPADRARIEHAVAEAARRRPELDADALAMVRRVLLFELGGPAERDPERDRAWLDLVLKWQQLTGPLMAKGQEDTALYQYNRLLSLNMVGGEPDPPRDQVGAAGFHRHARAQVDRWWGGLTATSTHDSKRSEDVRGRLNVLADAHDAWQRALWRWHRMNAPHRRQVNGHVAPDANEELFLYQTLVGAWPQDPADRPRFRERLARYLVKAAREAKVHTSWTRVNEAYEQALLGFADTILDPARAPDFAADLERVVERVALHGAVNSLAQLALKIAAPGVPDFYQGTELWTLTLVDPDNREPVDLAARTSLLADLDQRAAAERADLCASLCRRWQSGAIKLYITSRGLRARREQPALFLRGSYTPLDGEGARADHIIAFARHLGDHWLIAAVPRLPATLGAGMPLGRRTWRDTAIRLPDGAPTRWRDVLSGEVVTADQGALAAGQVFHHLPVSLLRADTGAGDEA